MFNFLASAVGQTLNPKLQGRFRPAERHGVGGLLGPSVHGSQECKSVWIQGSWISGSGLGTSALDYREWDYKVCGI